MPISEESVVAIYRYVLGREPESREIVQDHARNYQSVDEFRRAVITSAEFHAQYLQFGSPQFTHDKWVKTDIRDGLSMWVNLRDAHVSRACLMDNWEEPVVQFILSRIEKGDGFIDIGANIGWFSLIVGQKLKRLGGGQIMAFEPRSDLHAIASRSVRENDLDDIVTLHKLALADADGELVLAWNDENAATTYLATQGFQAGERHETAKVGRLDDVPMTTAPRIIKSDAEGAEGLLFKGAEKLLRQHRPIIVAELNIPRLPIVSGMSADDFLAWMKSVGYDCFLLTDHGMVGSPVAKATDTNDPAANIVLLPA